MNHPAQSLTIFAPLVRGLCTLAAVSALFLTAAPPAVAQDTKTKDKKSEISTPWGGLSAGEKASLLEVGLPAYPGARPHKESPSDDSEAKLSFWTRSLGMKLVVMKFESDDAVEEVSAHYQKALAKYGKVLTCTGKERKASKDEDSDELTCDDSEPPEGGVELRGGTKERRRIVAIGPRKSGKGCEFALVYLEMSEAPREVQ